MLCPKARPIPVGWGTKITRGSPPNGVALEVEAYDGTFAGESNLPTPGYLLVAGNGSVTTWGVHAGGWPYGSFSRKPSPTLLASGKLSYLTSFDTRLTVYCRTAS